jgi:hypothetical protein
MMFCRLWLERIDIMFLMINDPSPPRRLDDEHRPKKTRHIHFFVLDALAVDEDVVFLPPLSSLVVEDADFAELTEVVSVLPADETTAAEALEDPEPEAA